MAIPLDEIYATSILDKPVGWTFFLSYEPACIFDVSGVGFVLVYGLPMVDIPVAWKITMECDHP